MLRALVVLLLLANALWWAWSQGWLPASALPFPTEAGQREPQRVAAQQRPDSVRILPSAEARRLAAAACLQVLGQLQRLVRPVRRNAAGHQTSTPNAEDEFSQPLVRSH